MLTSKNGVLQQTENATETIEIATEKEQIQLAYITLQDLKLDNSITSTEIENELKSNNNDVEVMKFCENFIIKFQNSNRYYEISKNGTVSGPQIKNKDEFPGDISKGGKYNGENKNTAYQINCIEDLVAFSISTNGGNSELGIASNYYKGKYIILTKDLDFKSSFSYENFLTQKYGDLNNNGIIEDLAVEMTNENDDCKGFNPINRFNGIFDGNGYEIKNLYVKSTSNAGLFGSTQSCTIKNLGVTGKIVGIETPTAGIVAQMSGTIINCYNKCYVTGSLNQDYTGVGGITGGGSYVDELNIINCYNEGTINCTINTYINLNRFGAGGIIGFSRGQDANISNCYNIGNISSSYLKNGILGGYWAEGNISIYNCCDFSATKSISSQIGGALKIINNCYYIDCDNIHTSEYIKSQNFINELNAYIDNNMNSISTNEWRYWIIGTNGYPTFV